MKNSTLIVVSAILLSVTAVSQAGVLNDAAPYSIIDGIIKALLEKLRPALADLKFKDINEVLTNEKAKGTIKVTDILIQNADKFHIQKLKSDVLPPKLSNLTLTLNDLTASAKYDFDVNVKVSNVSTIRLHGKGQLKAVLSQIFFTIGANIELKDKSIQIKEKGLFGFDLRIGKADITVTSLLGSEEFGTNLGKFLSRLIPDAVETFRKPIFELFQDDIIRVLNKILKHQNLVMMDKESSDGQEMNEESFDSQELKEIISQALDLSEESESEFSEF